MGRPPKDLESHKELILSLLSQRTEHDEIRRILSIQRGLKIGDSVLRKHIKAWGKSRGDIPPCRDEKLRDSLIMFLFLKQNANEEEILVHLEFQDLAVTPRKLRRLRIDMGLRRRRKLKDARFQDEEIIRIMKEHLSEGVIGDWGLTHLYAYFRRNNIIISRDDIMYGLRVVDPAGVSRRYQKKQHRRKKFLVEGPNAIWSLDAHCKVEIVGIQIYAVIDAYSRKIIWIYVGISARTAVSVVKQFLEFMKEHKIMPDRFRSDRGTETILIADAFHQLCGAQEDRSEENCAIDKCWMFGKSTANQRIEAWWMQLQSSMLNRWVIFFDLLKEEKLFKKDKLADMVAVYAIYMPLIREACYEFVTNWNVHKIRAQKNRPHVTAGKPWFLYAHPSAPAVECGSVPDPSLVDTLHQEVEAYDLHEYLPAATLEWCHERMRSLGFDPATLTAKGLLKEEGLGRRAHGYVFGLLRGEVQQHLNAGNKDPILSLIETPKGAGSWKPSAEAERAFNDARRGEEPEEFMDHLTDQLDDVLVESDDKNYPWEAYASVDDEEG
ncbi:hypothetical protein HO173_003225 [Letharia columbiana]|uniref:Integrase core domain-containing protein n=1 Tax=Letharia columbiana TaxID=112416 RepID=A0A8H6G1D7_9LECA|nr:uncharacterized protein HO173_003225 [Letharia columbiana]KAF6238719.1 hypothetical protein HO173_003225 [Letharia columbiana]